MNKNKSIEKVKEELEVVKEKKKFTVKDFIKELIPYVIILVVVIIIRTYFITPVMVSGPSMQPTLSGGEVMILNRKDSLERFDVVVVSISSEDIIKRIIAMPGETISCENGIVYVNGRRQDENYSTGITHDFTKVTLSDDEYFVMGDNRQDSKDSRHEDVGPVKRSQIKGTARLVLFPFNKIGNIE